MKTFHKILTLFLLTLPLVGCGTNLLESQETEDPAEDAAIALEQQDPDAAIKILEDALQDDPDNAQYISILSLAYAQRAGVDPLTFALNLATDSGEDSDSDSEESSSQYEVMFALLPDPTTQNLEDITEAVTLLTSIDAADFLPGDTFKLAMFQTASFVMQTKRFDADLDGGLSASELSELSAEDAAVLLGQLDQVSALLASSEDDAAAAQAAESITAFQAELDAAEGDTDEEKLRNYLASS